MDGIEVVLDKELWQWSKERRSPHYRKLEQREGWSKWSGWSVICLGSLGTDDGTMKDKITCGHLC